MKELSSDLTARFSRQILAVQDRIEYLEKELDGLKKAVTYDWKRTDSGSLYNVFFINKNFDDAQIPKSLSLYFPSDILTDALNETEIEQEVWFGTKTKTSTMSSPDSTYSNFDEKQPLKGCTSITSDGKWHIKDCSELKPFICQRIFLR
ncbi:unnamed protein product [Enterobius vermicularis]|uniref:C-type lectin domain-containing protein n=1 Tax=Enterobius vermicularis TaxID=51028 RepID=A0A0N4UW43_ENTVE|nr:unnamed protein product [Enterobius vermicularis]